MRGWIIFVLGVFAAEKFEAQNPWRGLQQLVGTWKNLHRGIVEYWTFASPDTLRGTGYALTAGEPILQETMMLFRRADGQVIYRLVETRPHAEQAVDFPLTFFTSSSWTFENPEHSFPQTIEYWLADSSSLRVTRSALDGDTREFWFGRADEAVLRLRSSLSSYEVWVCNRKGSSVERFDAHTGKWLGRLFEGTSSVRSFCLDSEGRLYLLIGGAVPTVLRVNPLTARVDTFVQIGALKAPTCLAFGPDRNLYVGEHVGDVLCFDGDKGHFVKKVAEGLALPAALAWDSRNRLLIACTGGRGIWRVSNDGTSTSRVTPEYSLKAPTSLCLASDGKIFVADADETASIKCFQITSDDVWQYVGPVAAGFGWPEGLTVGPDGYLYACDSRIHVVRKIDPITHAELGIYLEGSALNGPGGLIFRKKSP
ncbi:MAG: DUF6265 family protein [Saprospiraceae bacterium]|nr:DUF6265 family protein [Saprospiraceae bacterium]MDW8483849.1 DUF6265 family protein [Saprospiraceae bacterium]